MEELLKQEKIIQAKCVELRRKVKLQRTDDAYEELRQTENERYRIYYKYSSKYEKERVAKWLKEQSKISVTCEICNIQLKKPSLPDHRKSKKHLENLKQQGFETDSTPSPNEKIKC